MTIPLIKCRNLTTGEVCTIPSETGFPQDVFEFMNAQLSESIGKKNFNNLDFYVHETENFKYCALTNEVKTNDRGKKSTIRYSEEDVIQFCRSIERFAEENFSEMISYAHDIQYMIGTFVHRSIVNKSNETDIDELKKALNEINVLAAIISAKDCFFRYRTGTYPSKLYSIDITGKFYKIFKAYEKFGLVKKKQLKFNFNSQKVPTVDTYEVFDFIPYILLENAVKYSPVGAEIDIDIKKSDSFIVVEIGSFGPALEADEKGKIFEKSFRGKVALEMGIKGQGLGLYHLKQAISDLGLGLISVYQERSEYPLNMDGYPHSYTTFTLKIHCSEC